MKAENKHFLDINRSHYDSLIKAGVMSHLDSATREGLLRVVREEFAPNYMATLWCSPCVVELVKYAFVQYDKWIEEHKDDDKVIMHATFPKHDKPKQK